MQFRCPVEKLALGLETIACAVAPRKGLPNLTNVLLSVTEKLLTLTRTNLEIGMRYRLQIESVTLGDAAVPFKNLHKFLCTFRTGDVDIAPLQQKGIIAYNVLNPGQLKKYLNADW